MRWFAWEGKYFNFGSFWHFLPNRFFFILLHRSQPRAIRKITINFIVCHSSENEISFSFRALTLFLFSYVWLLCLPFSLRYKFLHQTESHSLNQKENEKKYTQKEKVFHLGYLHMPNVYIFIWPFLTTKKLQFFRRHKMCNPFFPSFNDLPKF